MAEQIEIEIDENVSNESDINILNDEIKVEDESKKSKTKSNSSKRLKDQDRYNAIAYYVRNKGESPEGYLVTEDPPGVFHVKTVRVVSKKDQLLHLKHRFEKKIVKLNEEIKSLEDGTLVEQDKVSVENLNETKKKTKNVKKSNDMKSNEVRDDDDEDLVIETDSTDEPKSNESKSNEVKYKIQEPIKPKTTKKSQTSNIMRLKNQFTTRKISFRPVD
jgi:hypothetical protein